MFQIHLESEKAVKGPVEFEALQREKGGRRLVTKAYCCIRSIDHEAETNPTADQCKCIAESTSSCAHSILF